MRTLLRLYDHASRVGVGSQEGGQKRPIFKRKKALLVALRALRRYSRRDASPRGETDITRGFEPRSPGSTPGGDTKSRFLEVKTAGF